MFLTGVFIAGSALYTGIASYRERKKRQSFQTVIGNESPEEKTKSLPVVVARPMSFLADMREQQMALLSQPSEKDKTVQAKKINRNLVLSSVAMGLATAGVLGSPVLGLLSIPFCIYPFIYIADDAIKALREGRLKATLIDSLAIIGPLLAGFLWASAFANLLYFTGQKLLLKTEDDSREKLFNIFGEQPRFVWQLVDGVEVQTPFEELVAGSIVVVGAGEIVPIDGVIVDGLGLVDQHSLTGEAAPVEKENGAKVFASTVVLSGRIWIEVENAGTETVAAQIGEIWSRTADYKASIESKGEMLSEQAVLPTLGIGALALSTLGPAGAVAAIASNFTENLRIISPLGMLNFMNLAAQNGILIKDGRALEILSRVDTVVFDKTGTLTLEQPHVANVRAFNGFDSDEMLVYAASAESRQTHPVARAILQAAEEAGLALLPLDEGRYEVGYGIAATVTDRAIRVGSLRFMEMEQIAVPAEVCAMQEEGHTQGYSYVYVAIDGELGGAIELHPTGRPEASAIVDQLRERNLDIFVISGDHEQPTRRLTQELGIENYFAEVLPGDKAGLVERLQDEGRTVCFIGDGINDALALKQAHVSISLSGASAVATDTAHIILMDQTLTQLVNLFSMADDLNENMRRGVATTFVPGIVCVGGIFFLHFGILSALIFYNISMFGGVVNAMLPALRNKQNPLQFGDRQKSIVSDAVPSL